MKFPKIKPTSILRNNPITKFLIKVIPYGKPIEKIYLFVLFILFIVLAFRPSSVITESVDLIVIAGIGGLFILRSIRNKVYFPKTFTLLYTAFFLFSILTTVFSINVYSSILKLIQVFASGILVILGYDLVYGKYARRWLLNAFVFAWSCILVYGVVLYIQNQTSLIDPLGFPLYIGAITLALLPFSLSSTLKTKGQKKVLFSIATIIFTGALALTFSKLIYVIGALEILAILYFNFFVVIGKPERKKVNILNLAIIFVVVATSVILLNFPTSSTIPFGQYSLADRNISVPFREDVYRQAWNAFKGNAIVGVGLGNFKTISLYYQDKPWLISYYLYNDIGEMFVDEGILGGLLFLSIFIYIIYSIFKKDNFVSIFLKQTPDAMELSIGILSLIIIALFSASLNVAMVMFVLFLFIGILLKDLRVDKFKRFYFGNLSIGVVNGFAAFFIIIGIYFFFIQNHFNDISAKISISNLPQSAASIEQLVQLNPLDGEYTSILSQIYLYQSNFNKVLSIENLTNRYNRKDPYFLYTKAEVYYLQKNYGLAKKNIQEQIKLTPYVEPAFYVLELQIDKSQSDNKGFMETLTEAAKKFPINSDFYLYQPLFNGLGYTNSLSTIYIDLAISTNNNSYYGLVQKINPGAFGFQ